MSVTPEARRDAKTEPKMPLAPAPHVTTDPSDLSAAKAMLVENSFTTPDPICAATPLESPP